MIFLLSSENDGDNSNNSPATVFNANNSEESVSPDQSAAGENNGNVINGHQEPDSSQGTSSISGIASYLWETGKRRFSVNSYQQGGNNVSTPLLDDPDVNKNSINSDLDSVDEDSYKEAARLLRDSTNQKSVSYDSLTVSNNNVVTAENNKVIPSIHILPFEGTVTKIKRAVTGKLYYQSKKHLYLQKTVSSPPKKVVIIGIHGFFPHPNIRKIIGNPTGTSHRFIQEAEKAVRDYYGKSDNELDIFSIALEKEGKVFERVDHFYDVLSENESYLSKMNEADLVYFVAHSQGCPTTLILLAKLLKNELLMQCDDYNDMDKLAPKIGVLCMAGIMNGPVYYKDRYWFTKLYFKFEGERLLELFQFQNFNSLQMTILRESIEFLVTKNCKICFVGSLSDQLVPLYSSCCYYLKPHPNIFRSCYVDTVNNANLHKKTFLINLVRLSLKLLNLGHTDNKMLLNVSQFLIGKMSGKGHSSLYYDSKVYLQGFRFAWETSDIVNNNNNYQSLESQNDEFGLKFQRYNIEKLDFTNKLNTSMINKKLIWASLGFLTHLKHLRDRSFSVWDYVPMPQNHSTIETSSFRDEFFAILDSFWDWRPETTDKDMTCEGENSRKDADDGTTISDLVYWKNGLARLLAMNGYDRYRQDGGKESV